MPYYKYIRDVNYDKDLLMFWCRVVHVFHFAVSPRQHHSLSSTNDVDTWLWNLFKTLCLLWDCCDEEDTVWYDTMPFLLRWKWTKDYRCIFLEVINSGWDSHIPIFTCAVTPIFCLLFFLQRNGMVWTGGAPAPRTNGRRSGMHWEKICTNTKGC